MSESAQKILASVSALFCATTDQEADMHQTPEPPGGGAADAYSTEVGDRGLAADRGQAAEVAIAERPWWGSPGNSRADHRCDIQTALFGGWRQSRHGLAIPGARPGSVTDGEDVR